MKKLVLILLLTAFVLPACEKKKNDIEMTMPTLPPDLESMQPTEPPQ